MQIPDHQGVINVGGRVGAQFGPLAFRRAFSRLKHLQPRLAHEVSVGGLTSDLARSHLLAAEQVTIAHKKTGLSVVVGGGHDHGYSHLLGIQKTLDKNEILGCINIDAHLDVRSSHPIITSGSPFFLAIENGTLLPENFIEFGIQPQCNSQELWDYVVKKKIQVIRYESLRHGRSAQSFRSALENLSSRCDQVVISLDLDSVAQAYAPGVSAPQAEGFSSSELLEMMELAGSDPKVTSLGIFELNPEHDRDDQTALLAATAAHRYLATALDVGLT